MCTKAFRSWSDHKIDLLQVYATVDSIALSLQRRICFTNCWRLVQPALVGIIAITFAIPMSRFAKAHTVSSPMILS